MLLKGDPQPTGNADELFNERMKHRKARLLVKMMFDIELFPIGKPTGEPVVDLQFLRGSYTRFLAKIPRLM